MNVSHSSKAAFQPSFWRDRSVLVTGASGLVGGWLVKQLLEAEADVICLIRDWTPNAEIVRCGDLDRVTVVRGDICDQDCLERILGEHEVSTVMHLAAQTIVGIANRNPISTFEANIGGTWKLMEACRRSPKVEQIVVASSDKAYGDAKVLPYTEETPLVGMHPYDVSKSCGDLIAQTYANTYDLPVCVTRCGNFYGGGDLNWNRIIPGTIRSVLRDEAPVIRSDGSFVRDYFYVEDGAAAYMHLAEQMAQRPELSGEAFNLSTEIQVSVLDLVNQVLEAMGSSLQPSVLGEASNEIQHQYLDASKARDMLNWRPDFSLNEGLARTIQWYQDYFENHQNQRSVIANVANSIAAA
ncbi:MAG: sugar dehydratase [Rhodopirellula sp.]|jgi:CDP-glucose 4,6-dehydratase|uniref:CDP-glucose 4,6-dehydratase n=1 Tax=Rhodopirellula europaea SH398 TaxID=1263868 RepID=M5S3V2_9BACT|nr:MULTISPECIES: GDP-mannose 4,6-dehydratase [Rhodopirellula]EMI26288.1 CDP-glucose 4,6-dehydratase [Rhodopirellula europaea SH398]MAP07442.1 sugar dehydratase [Rhodopirellula sp.]MCR9207924.1 GDP-mannose 4,6-dehydratase [bacterium]|tara:strand:- start:1355 stop:2416 length:1062 start_codon:yes stop_codon:yes gene_type:complete